MFLNSETAPWVISYSIYCISIKFSFCSFLVSKFESNKHVVYHYASTYHTCHKYNCLWILQQFVECFTILSSFLFLFSEVINIRQFSVKQVVILFFFKITHHWIITSLCSYYLRHCACSFQHKLRQGCIHHTIFYIFNLTLAILDSTNKQSVLKTFETIYCNN